MGISAVGALRNRRDALPPRPGHAEACPSKCNTGLAGCAVISSSAGKMPAGLTGPSRAAGRWLCYGDFFGEADADAAAGDVVGDVVPASAGFALSSSTSKIRVAFGPMSPPAPPGP